MANGNIVHFGRPEYQLGRDSTLWKVSVFNEPRTLVFGDFECSGRLLGVQASSKQQIGSDILIRPPYSEWCPELLYTAVPLDHVRTIHALFNRYNNFAGMILKYRDASTRAIGECRLGTDRAITVHSPQRFCFARMSTAYCATAYTVEVDSDPRCQHDTSDGMWSCYLMQGALECWMSAIAIKFVIKGQRPVREADHRAVLPGTDERYCKHPKRCHEP